MMTLASTWRPRGEMQRFQKLRSALEQHYQDIIIVVPRQIGPAELDRVKALDTPPDISIVVSPEPPWSRYLALQASLKSETGHIHYVDMDRLLRWVETRPEEWQQVLTQITTTDCLIIGRTEAAFETHPQALQQTERIINAVFSRLLGQVLDLGGGSRGFSRAAVEYLMDQTSPGPWVDAEWPMLLHQAGFGLDYLAVDGLDWESADRYRCQAADPATQRQIAEGV